MDWKFKEQDTVQWAGKQGVVIATLPADSELCTCDLAKIAATACTACPGHTDSFFLNKLRQVAHYSKVDRYLVLMLSASGNAGKFLTPRKNLLES